MTTKSFLKFTGLHLLVLLLGLLIFIALFSTPLFASVLLFYRGFLFGVLVTALIVGALLLLKKHRNEHLTYRDIIIAAQLFLFTAITIFFILPVTLDRSISVFMLGYMANHPEKPITVGEMDSIFIDDYVHTYQSTQRRFTEQIVSKNVVQSGNGYVLSPRGARLVEFFRFIATIFSVDRRFIDPQ